MKLNVNLWMKSSRTRQLHQLKEAGLKRKINAENEFPSKIKKAKME